jgi:hypothetical protein
MAVTTSSPVLAGLDRAIEVVEAEARALRQQQTPGQALGGAQRGGPVAPAPPQSAAEASPGRTLEDLTVYLARLKQMKDWLQQDERLLPIVDDYIGQRVHAMEKRTNATNLRLSVITTVAGAILGWLTSLAATPSALMHAFFH